MKHHEYEMTPDGPVGVRVITFGSVLEETPEGFYAMESLRRDADAERAALEPWERDLADALNREIDRRVLGL